MFCDECRKRPATVHITQIINNKKTVKHLCEQCAREYQQGGISFSFEPAFSIQHLLSSLLHQEPGFIELSHPGISTRPHCSVCQLDYSEFAQQGSFGCPKCYKDFAKWLDPLMRKIHGNAQHNGKVPQRAGKALALKRELEKLYNALQTAVRQEAFEKAAELRDKIRELEKKIKN